jgi:hypothetical protein
LLTLDVEQAAGVVLCSTQWAAVSLTFTLCISCHHLDGRTVHDASQLGASGGNVAASIALKDASRFRFPDICSHLLFSAIVNRRLKTGKIPLNELPLLGFRIVSLNVRVWA